MKNKTMLVISILCLFTMIASVSAIEKPVSNTNLVFDEKNSNVIFFSIEQPEFLPTDNLEGSPCDVEYSTSAGYCSGDIRQYYQCMNTMQGLQYTQKSENCGNYDPIMYCGIENNVATCTDKKPLNWKLILAVVGIIAVAYFIFRKRK